MTEPQASGAATGKNPITALRERIAARPNYPWYVVAVTCVGSFMGQFDASVVQLALPDLAVRFATRETVVSWVALAYVVAFSAALPPFGRLCEMFGRKRLYLLGMTIFLVTSALCGMAGSLGELIAFRVVQGVGAALLGANSIAILVHAAGNERRPRAMGYFSAAQAVGVSLGPIVGGLLLGSFGWPAIFWVTVPVGIVGVAVGWLVLPDDFASPREKGFDWLGMVLLGPAIVALVVVLTTPPTGASPRLRRFRSLVAGVALLALFIWRERAQRHDDRSEVVRPRAHSRSASSPSC